MTDKNHKNPGIVLLSEDVLNPESNIQESYGEDGKNLFLEGVFMQANKRNRNGRIYKTEDMKRICEEVNEKIERGEQVLGELDHPAERFSVQLDNVSHSIEKLYLENDNDVKGRIRILNSCKGPKVRNLIEQDKIKPGVSSRGAGKVNKDGIVESFKFSTIDIVYQPSCRQAVPVSITEAMEIMSSNDYQVYKEMQDYEEGYMKGNKEAEDKLVESITNLIKKGFIL